MLKRLLKSLTKKTIQILMVGLMVLTVFSFNTASSLAKTSRPEQGETSLNQIQERTDSAAQEHPEDIKPERVSGDRQPLNLVQGDADKDKMISPEDADSETVPDKIKNFFSNVSDN